MKIESGSTSRDRPTSKSPAASHVQDVVEVRALFGRLAEDREERDGRCDERDGDGQRRDVAARAARHAAAAERDQHGCRKRREQADPGGGDHRSTRSGTSRRARVAAIGGIRPSPSTLGSYAVMSGRGDLETARDLGQRPLELLGIEATLDRELVRACDRGIDHVEIQMDVDGVHVTRELLERVVERLRVCSAQGRGGEAVLLRRIDVTGADEQCVLCGNGSQSLDGVPKLAPAVSEQHGEPHSVEEPTRRRVGRVEVPVGVEPDDADWRGQARPRSRAR